MLLIRADEVARNGALRRLLRPEVFPYAPLQYYVCRQAAFRPVSRPSPEGPPWNEDQQGNGRSAFCCLCTSRKKQSPEFSGKNQLILHVDASLTQQPGYRVAIQS